jgi:hypothetical protein
LRGCDDVGDVCWQPSGWPSLRVCMGWKGLAMSIAIAVIYSAAAFTGVILWLRSRPPTGDLIAGIAGVGVIIIGGISLTLAIIGGIIGAILHRRRGMQQYPHRKLNSL